MEAMCSSKASGVFRTMRRYNPEDITYKVWDKLGNAEPAYARSNGYVAFGPSGLYLPVFRECEHLASL
jgi:hypothetical protein